MEIAPALVPDPIEAFLTNWRNADGSERANYQLFLTQLCTLLDMPLPAPATGQPEQDSYVFERRVQFRHGDESESAGFIDLYRRGEFVLEAKKLKPGLTAPGFDAALLRARSQAESYARARNGVNYRRPFIKIDLPMYQVARACSSEALDLRCSDARASCRVASSAAALASSARY